MTSKKFKIFLGVVGGFFIPFFAWADTSGGGTIFNEAYNELWATFERVRPIVYALSGFGMIGVAIGGIMGKINWKWLASLTAALAILSMADHFIAAATDVNVSDSPINLSDGGKDRFDLSGSYNDSKLDYNSLVN